MNKRLNTFLFVLGATVLNLIIMGCLAVLGFLLLSLLPVRGTGGGIRNLLMIIIFFGAIVGSFFIYHRIVKIISKRVDMDKYFHPIFRSRDAGDNEKQ